MQKIILVSFADSRYRNALARLEKYTRDFHFTERHFHTEKNTFTRTYWKRLKPWIYRRGYGYWEWKALLVKQYLETMKEGDIIFWSDAGVYWNSSSKAIERFNEYIEILKKENDLLVFQEPYKESDWTKGDIFEVMNVYNDETITSTLQIWGGCFGIRKTKNTADIISKWSILNKRENELVTDKKSQKPNKKGFIENRHDQSTFSVLVKTYPHKEISYKETQVANNEWEKLSSFPIQARRHKEKERPLNIIIWNKLLRPYRFFLYIWFTKYKGYHFSNKSFPW
ncbi:MAG: hypothetical protein J6K41_05925 [Paraprevotella sp.]|nr:hypothetical protein [Paraprevotella sp.]